MAHGTEDKAKRQLQSLRSGTHAWQPQPGQLCSAKTWWCVFRPFRLLHHLLQQAARQGMGPMLFTDVHMSFNRQCDTLLQTRPQDKAECMRFLKVLGGHVHAFLRCM